MRGSITTVSNIYPHSTAGPFFALSTYTGRQGLSSHHLPIQDGRVYPTSVHMCPHRTTGHFYPTSTLTAKMILAVGALCWDNSRFCYGYVPDNVQDYALSVVFLISYMIVLGFCKIPLGFYRESGLNWRASLAAYVHW